ncbi:hypothetical protein J6590_014265 [Homalodisca vitripennis]|nr:hypothetical protein J6590_014265 [Homalodisca vitripennis]
MWNSASIGLYWVDNGGHQPQHTLQHILKQRCCADARPVLALEPVLVLSSIGRLGRFVLVHRKLKLAGKNNFHEYQHMVYYLPTGAKIPVPSLDPHSSGEDTPPNVSGSCLLDSLALFPELRSADRTQSPVAQTRQRSPDCDVTANGHRLLPPVQASLSIVLSIVFTITVITFHCMLVYELVRSGVLYSL